MQSGSRLAVAPPSEFPDKMSRNSSYRPPSQTPAVRPVTLLTIAARLPRIKQYWRAASLVRAEITGAPTKALFPFWSVADSRARDMSSLVHGDGFLCKLSLFSELAEDLHKWPMISAQIGQKLRPARHQKKTGHSAVYRKPSRNLMQACASEYCGRRASKCSSSPMFGGNSLATRRKRWASCAPLKQNAERTASSFWKKRPPP
jgi:hypothetical protein